MDPVTRILARLMAEREKLVAEADLLRLRIAGLNYALSIVTSDVTEGSPTDRGHSEGLVEGHNKGETYHGEDTCEEADSEEGSG